MNINIDNKELEKLAIIVSEMVVKKIRDVDLTRNEFGNDYMNKKQAAKYIGVSPNTLEKFIRNGLKVIVMDDTTSVRLKKETIDEFMARHEE